MDEILKNLIKKKKISIKFFFLIQTFFFNSKKFKKNLI